MTANERRTRLTAPLKLHGQAGLLIIFLAEALLFSGNQVVGRWFTPIVWTGYILFVDALVYKLKGESLLVTNRQAFLIIAVVSMEAGGSSNSTMRLASGDLELWTFSNCDTNASLLFA